MRLKHFLSVFLTLLTLGVGQMWGAIALSTSDVTLNSFSSFSGSGYKTNSNYTISGYSGFNAQNCMLSSSNLQMNKSNGSLTSPTITSSAGFDITITYTSQANMTITIGEDSETGASPLTLSTTSTNATFVLSTGSKYAVVSSIVLSPKAAATKHTVTLMDDTEHPLEENSAGSGVTLPTRTGCLGYTFAGWTASWEEEQTEWTSTEPNIITAGTYYPSSNISLFPVYTKIVSGESVEHTESFSYSSHTGWTLSSTIDKGSYYLLQKNCYIESPTLDDLSSITSIVIGVGTFASKGNGKVSDGTTTYSTFSPAGNSNGSITLQPETNPLSGSGKIRIVNTDGSTYTTNSNQQSGTRFYSMTINYETTGDVTYYISVPNCCTPLGQINGSVLRTHF